MKIQLERTAGLNVIRSYDRSGVRINEGRYAASVIVMPEQLIEDWRPRRLQDLTEADVEAVAALRPEVVLLGTGARLRFPRPELLRPLVNAAIGFEAMDTGAACRTYNVLMAEGRRVAAALLIGGEGWEP